MDSGFVSSCFFSKSYRTPEAHSIIAVNRSSPAVCMIVFITSAFPLFFLFIGVHASVQIKVYSSICVCVFVCVCARAGRSVCDITYNKWVPVEN